MYLSISRVIAVDDQEMFVLYVIHWSLDGYEAVTRNQQRHLEVQHESLLTPLIPSGNAYFYRSGLMHI